MLEQQKLAQRQVSYMANLIGMEDAHSFLSLLYDVSDVMNLPKGYTLPSGALLNEIQPKYDPLIISPYHELARLELKAQHTMAINTLIPAGQPIIPALFGFTVAELTALMDDFVVPTADNSAQDRLYRSYTGAPHPKSIFGSKDRVLVFGGAAEVKGLVSWVDSFLPSHSLQKLKVHTGRFYTADATSGGDLNIEDYDYRVYLPCGSDIYTEAERRALYKSGGPEPALALIEGLRGTTTGYSPVSIQVDGGAISFNI